MSNHSLIMGRSIAGLLTICVLAAAATATADDSFEPNHQPVLDVPRISGSISIDGVLDDPGWSEAARADNFTQYSPVDGVAPPVTTVVKVGYDDTYFYLAFIAHDDPATIRASIRDRDEMFGDDYVGIMLDTFGDGAWYYEFFANPFGIQGDLRWSNGFGEDGSFNLVWESEGRITPDGYVVEMAIPFASLRFNPAEQQTWRATFWRNHPRDSRRQYSWATLDRDNPCFPCQFGTLKGFSNISSGKSLEILPSVVGSQASSVDEDRPDAGLNHGNPNGDVALTLKYAITTNLTAEAAVNPDFSQVESDVGQIDVNTTFALFFPERRPFFQEGSDLFKTFISAVYTRAINDPIVAVKGVGRMGKTSVGYLSARDDNSTVIVPGEEGSNILQPGKSTSNIFRVKRTLWENSYVGVLATDRRYDDGAFNSVGGIDGKLQFLKNYIVRGQMLGSLTKMESDDMLSAAAQGNTGKTQDGHSVFGGLGRRGRHWNFQADYSQTTLDFRADNGFVNRSNTRVADAWTGYITRPNTAVLEIIEPSISLGRIWNFDGVRKDEWLRPDLFVRFKGQTWISIGRLWSRELFDGIVFDKIRVWDFNFGTQFSDAIQTSFGVSPVRSIARNLDTPTMGEGTVFNGSVTVKPTQRLVIVPSWRYAELSRIDDGSEIFRAYILRSRINYQFTRSLFVRLVVQYADARSVDEEEDAGYARSQSLSFEPLLTYRANPFTTFFIGSTHGLEDRHPQALGSIKQTARQFFFKLQYLFRA